MRSAQFLGVLVLSACFASTHAEWWTHGRVTSKDFPNFKGNYKVNVFIIPDQFLGSCGETKTDVNGYYSIKCTPLIVPFTDPYKTVRVCHRIYGDCLCKTIKPVRTNRLDVQISPKDDVDKNDCSKQKYP
ncbi:unnamed protein product [Bursaphelenchus xylophilus]|nr:unnamed protein product [Bursaphelenchus xylophilus]CAG9113662.1 unnamed protein product [Bursaphelenchus xylophilus]